MHGVKEDLHLRIEEEVMRPVREYATANGISLAAAVSILLTRALQEGN
jgi:predicted HicB family RNase H-like nuclease